MGNIDYLYTVGSVTGNSGEHGKMSENPAVRHARRIAHRDYIRAKKIESGCVDCGYRDNAEKLHFHHTDPKQKVMKVSSLITYSLERIKAEIAKCVVKCEACHEDFHYPFCRR